MKDAVSWLVVKGKIYLDWCYLPGRLIGLLVEGDCRRVGSWALAHTEPLIIGKKEYQRPAYGHQN